MSAIHEAAKTGNLPEVLRLLDAGTHVDVLDDDGETPLLAACQSVGAPVALVRLLLDRGADPSHRTPNGYTPLIHAACGGRSELSDALLAAGATMDEMTTYGESALSVLSRSGEFGQVAALLDFGADPAPLKWTPLHRAAALGTPEDMESLLDDGAPIEAVDDWKRTPLLVAILAGKIENAARLLRRGANRNATGRCGITAMHYPTERDDAPTLRWLLDQGFPANLMDDFKTTPLMQAVEDCALACFLTLLDAGVEWRQTDRFGKPLIAKASHPEIISRLIELGQSAGDLEDEALRDWIGLGTRDTLPVTKAEFHAGRSRRFGTANPERMNVPFWNAMVRNGWDAWKATDQFTFDSCDSEEPTWSHARFGMSLTPLPDGRWVQIAGEHEDHYDPDFCIYNDVIVHDGTGGFELYAYPEDVFPPTDFHSATLVGEWIYVIGNLGYPETRGAYGDQTPVFRLHTGDWHIERVETKGESPGWIHEHQAKLDGTCIRVFQGKRYLTTAEGNGMTRGLTGSYELDLGSRIWRRRERPASRTTPKSRAT